MNGLNLLGNVKITKVADHSGAGTSDVTGATIDMQGFEGVIFMTSLGTAAANNSMKVQQGAESGMGDAADLAGTSVVSGTSDEDLIIDIYKPKERYLRPVVQRGTSSTCESIWAIQYGARNVPINNSVSGTQIAEQHVSPAEGTA